MEILVRIIFVLFSLVQCFNCADVFTSLERLRALMDFERGLPDILENYVQRETIRLEQLKMLQASIEETNPSGDKSIEYSAHHPSVAVNLVERFSDEWQALLAVVSNFSTFIATREKLDEPFHDLVPFEDDLRGAYLSFARLQEVYHLDTEQLMNGKIQNQTSGYRMDANDCYNMAMASLQRWQFDTAIRWLDQGLDLVHEGPLWELMAKQIGDLVQRVKGPGATLPKVETNSWREDYETLCRGEKLDSKPHPPLHCTYRGHGIPYAPWKEEVLNLVPYMVIFHDFISDGENYRIREEAFPSLSRARVGGQDDNHVSDVRVGKVAWLYTDLSPLSRMLSWRTADATSLECLDSAESFQIGNYGMGGHYEPHHDSDPLRFPHANIEGRVMGDRIATLMIYMSDVTAGGGTAFPKLGLVVTPKKNAAIFWYNLKKNGEVYDDSLHGACPVLLGNKWVANKWIHEFGQAFERPCDLSSTV